MGTKATHTTTSSKSSWTSTMSEACPKSGCNYEGTEHGVKVHYGKRHKGTISDNAHICSICERQFVARDSREAKCCSRLCYTVSQSQYDFRQEYARNQWTKCKNCGEWAKAETFCSPDCQFEWRKTQDQIWADPTSHEHTCPECGNEFEDYRDDAKFCSFSCRSTYHARRRELDLDVNPIYQIPIPLELRIAVYVRDAGRCQKCGLAIPESIEKWNKSLDIHHIRPRSEILKEADTLNEARNEANTMHNLVALCAKCHGIVERNQQTGV